MDSIKLIWKDRKRHFGLPLSFTKYSLSDDRLFLEKGVLNLQVDEVLLYRVRDLTLSMNLGQRIFGVGTLKVLSSDKTLPSLELKNIKNPRDVKETIHRAVEEAKNSRRMRTMEVMGDDGCEHDEVDYDMNEA